ncbi:MAG: nitrogen regulation protein NR(II) [Vicinamibacterales bacterium]
MSALRPRLARLVVVRVGAATLLLGLALALGASGSTLWPLDRALLAIAGLYGVALLDAVTVRFADRFEQTADLHFALDTLLIAGFVVATGGVSSVFTPLFALPVVAAAGVQYRHGSLRMAAFASACLLAIVGGQYTLYPPAGDDAVLPAADVARITVGINVFAFFSVAFLAGQLAENLRRADVLVEAASEKIADLEAFNRTVIDHLASGLLTMDAAGRVLTANRAAATITGWPGAVAGMPAAEALQLPPGFTADLAAAGPTTRARRVDYTFQRPDGRTIELGVSAAPLPLGGGERGVIFTFQDVTDIKGLERTAQVRQRLAAVGEMAAGIAHEIRNPLASMSGAMQMLRGELALSEEQAKLMDIVLRESDRLNSTISSFLAYARPGRVDVTRIDARRPVQDAAALLRTSPETAESHVIAVEVPDTPVWLDADEHQLRQIIWNLATNGLKAMPDGGRLVLFAGRDGDDALVGVRDEGTGIPADEVDAIFHPFRGSFARGSGLGLAIVHRIVTDYNGRIDVQSAVGRGTTIVARFPSPRSAATRPALTPAGD